MPGPGRIGFVTTSFPKHSGDASGSFVFELARALVRSGHTVEVVVPEPAVPADWDHDFDWLRGVRVHGAPYMRPRRLQKLFFGAGVPDNISRNPILAGLVPPALFGLLAQTARRARRWDALVSHWLVPSALISGLARKRDTRHLAIAHSADVHLLGHLPLGRILASAALRGADHMGFVTGGLRDEFLSLLAPTAAVDALKRSSVTPMGVDMDALAQRKSGDDVREDLGLDKFTVLFLGRLVPIKGVDLLIDAAIGASGIQIVIAGDGPERERLEKRASERGIDARFLGWIGPERRADLLGACDAVAVPSRVLQNGRHEGLPLVVLEALGAGCPVIAAASGGISEIIEDDVSGFLVPPGDVDALHSAMMKLKLNPDISRCLSIAGRKRAEVRDWNALVPIYEELILGV
ncbi:MAG: glycosyltransferase family 4 protein [Deltaproteobacteria bacterium]|nr:glycosyltransferase family 4 protein [Deltaproteobacteria bacterium]